MEIQQNYAIWSLLEGRDCSSPVMIEFCAEEQSTKIGNDTIYKNRCVYPIVTVDGNENAAAKINADIQARVEANRVGAVSFAQSARDEYDWYCENGYTLASPFSEELIFSTARADSNVISFLVKYQWYGGGAHGMDTYVGLNYDTQTGERIMFPELSECADLFQQNTLAFQQRLAGTAAYQKITWPDAVDELEEVLYQDDRWYFSPSGLVFFSNPYELGAFAAGKIEFAIPYTDLDEMGLKEKYHYLEVPAIRFQSEEPYFCDLNGDGQPEEIQFHIDAKGSRGTDIHFIIDGTDFAQQNEALSKQFSDENYIACWAECFLYDVDVQDDMIEIVFQMNYSNWRDDIVIPYVFFYHYEEDGSLIYLGTMEGNINELVALQHGVYASDRN